MLSGLHHGYGFFETMRVVDHKIPLLNKHLNRLKKTLVHYGMNIPSDLENTINEVLLDYNEGVLKLMCIKDEDETVMKFHKRPVRYTSEDYLQGYDLMDSDIKRHSENPIYKFKSMNYLNNMYEFSKTSKNTELVHFNEKRHVCEGVFTNIFWVKDGQLYTPDVACGLLSGVMREFVVETSQKLGFTVNIGYYNSEILRESDEIFITSAVMGIMPIRKYINRTYDHRSASITQRLIKEIKNGIFSSVSK